MGNWLKYKLLILVGLLILTSANQDYKKRWGFYGHKRINRMAIFTLPPEMFGFYKEHIEFLTEHAVDPDKRRYAVTGEAEKHYIDIDHYTENSENPFDVVPEKWNEAVAKFSEDTLLTYGIAPWNILLMKLKLQKAFENQNVDLILKYSSDIGHYIGDVHVPLHTTENYNGQLSNQKGIHGLWESRLVEIHYDNYDYFVGKSSYLKNLRSHIWKVVRDSHFAVDSVLSIEKNLSKEMSSDQKYSFERRGNITTRVYSLDFSKAYHERLNHMVERRLVSAIFSVGSIWYTAWVDAGQPDLSQIQNTPPSNELLEEMKQVDADFQHEHSKGRICE